jgi:O-antigen/teichoic acid export membrane protein
MPAIWLAAASLTSRPGGVAEYGLYAAAYNIKTLILFVPSVVATVTVPRLSFYLAANDDAHVRKTYFVAVATSFAVLAAAASVTIVGTDWILAIFGSDFSNGSGVFILVVTTGVVEGLCITLYSFFQATGRLWLPFFLFTIPRDVALVVSAHILCPIYGARGLAIAAMLAATYTICATLALLFIRERRHLLVTRVARSGLEE